jgi:hypothetical protein
MILKVINVRQKTSAGGARYDSAFKYRTDVDRYGFSAYLAERLGYVRIPRAFCWWQHGWWWFPIDHQDHMGTNYEDIVGRRIVVATNKQRLDLEKLGFKGVIAGGLPFGYILNETRNYEIENNPKRTIVILPKSQSYMMVRRSFVEMLEYVSDNISLKNDSVLMVYKSDLARNEVQAMLSKHNLPVIIGSDVNNPTDLVRTRDVLSSFERCVSNTWGSHVLYTCALGLDFSLQGPFDRRDMQYFMSDKSNINKSRRYMEYIEWVNSEEYLRQRFPFMFSPKHNIDYMYWAINELGCEFIMEDEALKSVLGWGIGSLPKNIVDVLMQKIRKIRRLSLSRISS